VEVEVQQGTTAMMTQQHHVFLYDMISHFCISILNFLYDMMTLRTSCLDLGCMDFLYLTTLKGRKILDRKRPHRSRPLDLCIPGLKRKHFSWKSKVAWCLPRFGQK
jgi:hypothetical protein